MPLLKYLRKSFVSPLLEFIHDSRAVGVFLIVSTILSLLISNSDAGEYFVAMLNVELGHSNFLPHSLLHWINDGLMAIFFFLVGMEIKRELMVGELSSFKKSLMPIVGALGGMLVPALLFTLFNAGTEYAKGWGIPMATDIAFSLGVASLLGSRAPIALKIFLTALAIIDDLGAIIAIAIFYTNELNFYFLLGGISIFLGLVSWNRLKMPFGIGHFIAGAIMWFCFFNSGIHATIAGVLLAFTIPLKKLENLVHELHVPVNFIIIPIFALANTAIIIPASFVENLTQNLSIGIAVGLILGKPIGIVLFCFIAAKLKWGELANGLTWNSMVGLGLLAGIGFTMSIFISMLAFDNPATQDISKMAVLLASVLAMLLAYGWFYIFTKEGKGKRIKSRL